MKRTVVVKIGGRLIDNERPLSLFIKGIKSLARRYAVVVVHGGGSEISSWLDRFKINYHFVNGRRFTSEEAVGIIEMVLSGKVNKFLVGRLNAKNIKSAGLSLRDALTAVSRRVKKLGCVGIPCKINAGLVTHLLKGGFLPVISTVSQDEKGCILNVNADTVCPMLAIKLKAEKLIYLTDVDGISGADSRTIRLIKVSDIDKLIEGGVIKGGMIPKVQSAAGAIAGGVKEVYILNGNKGINLNSGTRMLK